MIESWATGYNHTLTCTRFWAADTLPEPETIDLLVIMGGPMGVYEESDYPWLLEEKSFIRRVVESGRVVLGICLGAQLLASVCGASVYPHREKEIGWFPVTPAAAAPNWLKEIFPNRFVPLHWHGDTFDIPPSAEPLGSTSACPNQGFVLGDKIIALQFHPEMTKAAVADLVDNCRSELVPSTWVQSEDQILAGCSNLALANEIMERLLAHCARSVAGG